MAARRHHDFLERWPDSGPALALSKEPPAASLADALGFPFNVERACCHMYAERLSCVPLPGPLGICDCAFEPTFIRRRNERERQRVRCVNEGYARLRDHLPQEFDDKRLSKVETLRAAIRYIKHLQRLLEVRGKSPPADRSHGCESDGESQRGFSDGGDVG